MLSRKSAILSFVAVLLLALIVWGAYICFSSNGYFARREAGSLRRQLELIAEEELARSENETGEAGRIALNMAVKAQYALFKSADGKMDAPQRRLLTETFQLLQQTRSAVKDGEKEIFEEKGSRLRAYKSEIDGTIQTYSVSVPANYDAELKWPLIVSLHGHGWYGSFQGHPAPQYAGAICLSPQGRGSTDYKELGEDDVLTAIAEVKRDFNIDEERIYLTGSSMGGTGAFSIAVHYADMFAAVMPICGNADNEAWTEYWGWNRKYPGRNDALRKRLQNQKSARYCAENLLMLPVFVVAGSADTVVPVAHSRSIVELLRKYRGNVQYREFPNCGHGGYPKSSLDEALAWTCSWKKNREPASIFWKADKVRYGKAWWTRMEQFAAPLTPACIKANASAGRITVSTSNLLAFSLCCPETVCGKGPLHIVVDGKEVKLHRKPTAAGWVTLRKDAIHGWLDGQDSRNPEMVKKISLEGPIDDMFRAPFAVVVGTVGGSSEMAAAWRREAEAFVQEWQRRNGAPCRMIDDKDCTLEEMQKYNLLLFGGAKDNSVSELVAPYMPLPAISSLLPVHDEDPEEGRNGLEADDLGAFVLYPNTEYAPDKLVLMVTANSVQGAYQCWWRFGNWFNWGLYDSSKYFDYAVFDGHSVSPETMLIVGWFGTDWSLENGVYYLGNEKLRQETPMQRYPEYGDVENLSSESLPLAKLRPAKIEQMRGAIALGRGFFGENLHSDIAIGMRAPCSITYQIDGRFKEFTSRIAFTQSREMELKQARRKVEKVTFRIYGDDRLLKEETISWEEHEMELSAIVRGVRVLRLEALSSGGPSWQHSGAAWINPTLWCSGAPLLQGER